MSYFFFGSAKPNNSGLIEQYGLYNPVIGRFALVHHDPSILRQISKLFSSRYGLILCALHSAENFAMNLLDNSVCLNWGMDHDMNLSCTRLLKFDSDPYRCSRLQELAELCDKELIWQDREYLWCACCYVALFTKDIVRLGDVNQFVAEELPLLADLPMDPLAVLRSEIFQLIYREFDFESAQKQLDQLLHDFAMESPQYADITKLDLSIDRR